MKGINKIIKIDGIEIPMRASASSPRTYRQVFGKDLFMELDKLRNAYANEGEVDLEVIENMAYLFAYQANEEIPDIDTWLDQFGMTAIYEALPQILELWGENEKTNSKEKK
jgi:hypothetical protein